MKSTVLIGILVGNSGICNCYKLGILFSLEVESEDLGDQVNIAGKNRMYTALILHELDEYNARVISEKEITAIFDEYYQNIQLLKNGGTFEGRDIVPMVEEYLPELVDVENKFYEFESLKDELIESKSNNLDPSENYLIKHEIIEVELLDATDLLAIELAEYFSELNHEQETLQLILPIVNAIVYVVTVYVIFKKLRKEQKQIQKFEKL